MSAQGSLWEAKPRSPIARRSDPDTSHDAAREITASGQRDKQASAVLELVLRRFGSTAGELARLWSNAGGGSFGECRHIVGRRLSEIEKLGKIRRGEPRTCAATGKRALTWWRAWSP